MKYVELKPLTHEQLLKKAEAAWTYYDNYWTPSFAGEAKETHDDAIEKWMKNHAESKKKEKAYVESVDIFDEIIENATPDELTYCRGSKVINRIKKAYAEAMMKARENGDVERCKALSCANCYAENVVRYLAAGNVLPTTEPEVETAAETEADTAAKKCTSAWEGYPAYVIAKAQQIAEDMLANDDDGIIMVDPALIADEIMSEGLSK